MTPPDLATDAPLAERLGIVLASDAERSLLPVDLLVDLALRRNPKRAHLLVSRVLAKHVPTEPGIVMAAGHLLGLLVQRALRPADSSTGGPDDVVVRAAARLRVLLSDVGGSAGPSPARREAIAELERMLTPAPAALPDVVTIGYAETATGLGHLVAEMLGTYYLHSTRHAATGEDAVRPYGRFEEAHSHATSHQLIPTRHGVVHSARTVVLVDDELSTGATVINTVRELHAASPHARYVVASLIDLRSADDDAALAALAAELGCRIDVVALGTGSIHLPADLPDAAASFIDQVQDTPVRDAAPGRVRIVDATGSVPAIRSPRFGVDAGSATDAAAALAATLRDGLAGASRVLVLGTEEFMALPLAVAHALEEQLPTASVLFSTSTRSPIVVHDEPGYPIRSAVTFGSHDATLDGPGRRFAYNVAHPDARFDAVVVLSEPGTAADALTGPGSISDAVAGSGAEVHLVLLQAQSPYPRPQQGPAFGSYSPEDVTWLLKDLSEAQLEAPVAERELANQTGTASYAESLPEEFAPSAEYSALFHDALDGSKTRVAHAMGVVTEQVLALRGPDVVLVSLARAGTPLGILMKRWARAVHGIELQHYTASIVRGLGIDTTALSYLASHHRPEKVMFVDGWTGKGAIARELAAAVERFEATDGVRFPADLAVLADPGHCVSIFGTREDFLIPSACLNSTVSGLVSRTVFSRSLIGPEDFHGAKFYAGLGPADVSNAFLTAIEEQFGDVRDDVLAAQHAAPEPVRPDWSGWAAVERISREFGIDNVNLVKPGVGETTRVLLRRVPWKILIRPGAQENLQHILLLAAQRGVDVVEVPDLPYSCVGLIHPVLPAGVAEADA
ncbi:phosphoribosyltransferase domain-containing protein [Arthrobacter pityocampae]|uniref:phosphoribosyltransferase domain-containing protein n=1 Tax=Arthrobacter pityocampae TaxID=547334 RepID=UPI0037368D4D